jgi:ubiquinol-cytochrome c reductase cytochrome b subunit
MAANFRSCRDSGITWLALTGLETTRIMRRAGHDEPKTTLGYVKMAEDLKGKVGLPFGPLPADLLGQPSGQVNADPRKARGKRAPQCVRKCEPATFARAMPRSIENYVIIGAPLVAGTILFCVPLISNRGERSARRRPWAVVSVVFCLMMVGSLWILGAQAPWSPNFDAAPLAAAVVGATSGPVADGARVFHDKGCINCHLIEGHGGRRGPDLSRIGSLLTKDELTLRIVNGGTNMPAFAGNLSPEELTVLVAFLRSRRLGGPAPAEDDAGTASEGGMQAVQPL